MKKPLNKAKLKDKLNKAYNDLSAAQFLFQTGDTANAKRYIGFVKSDLKQQIKTL